MKKKYISAVLIPCLLFQLIGCYSWRVVEIPEPDSQIKIYTKDNKIIEPKNWLYEDGKFISVTSYSAVEVETTIEQKEINKIEERYFNGLKTGLYAIGFVALVTLTTLIIIDSSMQGQGFK